MLVTDTIQNYNKEDGIYTYKNNIMDFMLVDNTYYQYITSDINSLNNFLKLKPFSMQKNIVYSVFLFVEDTNTLSF